jgi:hypothetical protein
MSHLKSPLADIKYIVYFFAAQQPFLAAQQIFLAAQQPFLAAQQPFLAAQQPFFEYAEQPLAAQHPFVAQPAVAAITVTAETIRASFFDNFIFEPLNSSLD